MDTKSSKRTTHLLLFCILLYVSDISDITIEEIKVLLESSHFIQPYHLSLWKSAIDLYDRGQTGMATVAMLPLLEHGLRCLFTSVNNCSQRTVTAEVRHV